MSDLVDRESSGPVRVAAMPATDPQPSSHDAEIEREYLVHRAAVVGMLRSDFPRLDAEGLYNEAWIDLLSLEAAGEPVRSRRALLKTIAWRRAFDASKRRRPESLDPLGAAMTVAADVEPLPDEQAQLRLDGAALWLVIEQLNEQQKAVLKLRFDRHLAAREIQVMLGVSEKRLEAIFTEAYKKIAAQLEVDGDGQTAWTRRQRSLLLACEVGIASARQRRRAQQMLERDPACRAMLRAMRSSVDDVAAMLPMPVLVEERERLGAVGRATQRLDELWAAIRQLSDRFTGRGVPDTSVVEQVGAGGLGAGAGAVAVKAVALCLAVGGTAAICLERTHDRPAKPGELPSSMRRVVEPSREHALVIRQAKRTVGSAGSKAKSRKRETPVSSPKSKAPASPAPQGSTEFGPGTLGSSSASQRPAAAPQDGGGEFTP